MKQGRFYRLSSRKPLWKTEAQGGTPSQYFEPYDSDQFMGYVEAGTLVFYICSSKTFGYTHKVIVNDHVGWIAHAISYDSIVESEE